MFFIFLLLVTTIFSCNETGEKLGANQFTENDSTSNPLIDEEPEIYNVFHQDIVNIIDGMITFNDTMNLCSESSKSKILVFHFLNSEKGNCRFRIGHDNVFHRNMIYGHIIYRNYLIAYYDGFHICDNRLINVEFLNTSEITGYPNETNRDAVANYCEIPENIFEVVDSENFEINKVKGF